MDTHLHSIPKRAQFAKQSVLLHGWANRHFTEDRQAIRLIHQKMSANYKEGSLKPWEPVDGSDTDMTSKEYSARYFTPVQHANGDSNVQFSPLVDPYGHLKCALNSNLVHTAMNEVAYYQYVPLRCRQSE